MTGIEVLAKGCPALITFLACVLIGDDALTHLAHYCSRLHTVNIQVCLVNSLIQSCIESCFYLTQISIDLLQDVTDVGVARLSRSCLYMRYLCLSGCGHLSGATLSSLSQNCPQLATLEIANCSLFTDLRFQALARVKTKLNYLRKSG